MDTKTAFQEEYRSVQENWRDSSVEISGHLLGLGLATSFVRCLSVTRTGSTSCPSIGNKPRYLFTNSSVRFHSSYPAKVARWLVDYEKINVNTFLKLYFLLERGERREKEKERNISWLLLTCPQLGIMPPTQACALTGN